MSYIDENLIEGEHVIFRTTLSWWSLLHPTALLLCILTAGLGFLYLWLKRSCSQFAVTNKRVSVKLGILSRDTLELNLHKLESVQVDQGLFARMFGYGDVTLIGTGGTREPFRGISHPIEFRNAVNRALDEHGKPATSS